MIDGLDYLCVAYIRRTSRRSYMYRRRSSGSTSSEAIRLISLVASQLAMAESLISSRKPILKGRELWFLFYRVKLAIRFKRILLFRDRLRESDS